MKNKTFGYRLMEKRYQLGLSQQQIAELLSNSIYDNKHVNRSAVAQWESGAIKEIAANNLLKLAAILNVNPYWLLFGDNI